MVSFPSQLIFGFSCRFSDFDAIFSVSVSVFGFEMEEMLAIGRLFEFLRTPRVLHSTPRPLSRLLALF